VSATSVTVSLASLLGRGSGSWKLGLYPTPPCVRSVLPSQPAACGVDSDLQAPYHALRLGRGRCWYSPGKARN
jgi:hypothetical protein